MGQSIPYEIHQLIIDEASNDKVPLKICCLVSSHWRRRAQHWLFSEIELLLFGPSTTTKEGAIYLSTLGQLLSSPHSQFQTHVNTVCIYGPDYRYLFGFNPATAPRRFYDELDEITKTFLPHFPRIHRLTIDRISWGSLSNTTKSLISSLSGITAFIWRQVTFRDLPQAAHVISNFSRIIEFEIFGLILQETNTDLEAFKSPTTPSPPVAFPLVRTLVLDIRESDHCLSFVGTTTSIQPRHIVDLTLNIDNWGHLQPVADFILAAGSTLENLSLTLLPDVTDQGRHPFPISLSKNINLKLTQLQGFTYPDDAWWVDELLDSSLSPYLTIVMTMESRNDETDQSFDFELFRRLLAPKGGAACSQRRVIKLQPGLRLDKPSFERAVIRFLPDLYRDGTVEILPPKTWPAYRKHFTMEEKLMRGQEIASESRY